MNVYRKRVSFPDLKRAVLKQRSRYKPHTILIEDKASGTRLIQELRQSGASLELSLPPPNTDKLSFWLSQGEPWLRDYIAADQVPWTKHGDQVDSTTQFLDQ